MTKDLKDEIINWRFLDSWTGKLEWKKERHLVVNIYTDASMYKWGGYFKINDREHKVGDSWAQEMLSLPIMVLEAKAFLNVLRENMLNCTVILRADGVIAAWVPTFYEFIQDAFIVGNKGQRGVLKYPTKKGYVQDGFGLPGKSEYLMKKIWCPYITCSRCAVTNDIDFKYCKACGFARENKATDYQDEIKKEEEVLNKINNRISQLDALLDSASYSKQKCSLKNEMEKIFIFLDSRKNINNASPEDIRKFLISKKRVGKRSYM
ncbi:unnamed protein product [Mytilus coruscus]|uniref:Uncharacterized protein n=1 Tax=Mytilus coruscus TaxID=42192 RepID=A0A6J8BGF7_MYTCO|nr:unnamed protein product [Mytilus coruscus]